ncbi:hypothetical protein HYV57_04140 [Candidatus Peregrinibacteria bacterium]|nr:hypothetical protein [Candidatus Peregrinibacteria bacterium]
MQKICKQCQHNFEIFDRDLVFYNKISPVFGGQKNMLPAPTLCPDCRLQRRLSWRNERNLYKRLCDFSKKNIISVYSPDKPYKVYDHEAWWSDQLDATNYGRDFDFTRHFFEQFFELYKKIPKINFVNVASENSDYCNFSYRNKNCYLIFASHYNEDCQYGTYMWACKNCFDCLELIKSELIYEGIYSENCYQSSFIQYCFNVSDCHYCYDLIGCKNCLFSSNLRNKQYYIFNKPHSKDDYNRFCASLDQGNSKHFSSILEQYKLVCSSAIHRSTFQKNCEHCIGSDIQNSKNIYYGFNLKYGEDCSYVYTNAVKVKDCMDVSNIGYDPSELLYECLGNTGNTRALFCISCWHNSDLYYCEQCFNCKNLFGCIGLKNKEYCILNRQYSPSAYTELVGRILNHMTQTQEFGEFFPSSFSPFGYNETTANDYYPLSKEKALKLGFSWKTIDTRDYKKSSYLIPNHIKDVPESVTGEILACISCKKNYRITTKELTFYKTMFLPLPFKCPDCRHQNRLGLKNPHELWKRLCSHCKKEMLSTYSLETPETVYCEKCYLDAIY